MKGGGSKRKGSRFERFVGSRLSLWLTNGAQSDLFARTVLSGGQFTVRQKGGINQGQAGDLMAAHPLAFEFMSYFVVECKHHRDLNIDKYLLDRRNSTLAKIIDKVTEEATATHRHFMLIAKQNNIEPLVCVSGAVGGVMMKSAWRMVRMISPMRIHTLHNASLVIIPFEDMFMHVNAQQLFAELRCFSPQTGT